MTLPNFPTYLLFLLSCPMANLTWGNLPRYAWHFLLRRVITKLLMFFLQVFIDPESSMMGFPVIESRFQAEAHLVLKLAKQPPTSSIIPILIHHPPKDTESATKIFGYLANRVTGKPLTISM